MQIVIDIPEMTLLNITSRELLLCSREDIEKLEFAIKNGTPLKNITNEINNLASSPNAISAWYRIAIKDCLKVIDKYRKGEQKTETWNGIHAQITAPKGTFERIFNDADDDNDI